MEPATKRESKRTFWLSHQKAFAQSKLSQRAYCRQEQLNYHTFCYWRGKFRREQISPANAGSGRLRLVPIEAVMRPADKKVRNPLHISFADCSIEVNAQTDLALLQQVISVVRSSSCGD